MTFDHRRLPLLHATEQASSLGSPPPNRAFPGGALSSGQAFAAMDRLLDQTRAGPFYLRRPAMAEMVVEANPA